MKRVSGWVQGVAAAAVATGAWIAAAGMALADSTTTGGITAPDVNAVAPISSDQAIAWVQNIAGLAFAAGAAITGYFLVRLVIRMYGTDERGTPETMRQMMWFGGGFILLAGAAFWVGVLKGLAPHA